MNTKGQVAELHATLLRAGTLLYPLRRIPLFGEVTDAAVRESTWANRMIEKVRIATDALAVLYANDALLAFMDDRCSPDEAVAGNDGQDGTANDGTDPIHDGADVFHDSPVAA